MMLSFPMLTTWATGQGGLARAPKKSNAESTSSTSKSKAQGSNEVHKIPANPSEIHLANQLHEQSNFKSFSNAWFPRKVRLVSHVSLTI